MMKGKEEKSIELSKASKDKILSEVALKLKGRVLFPKLIQDAKEHLKKLKGFIPKEDL